MNGKMLILCMQGYKTYLLVMNKGERDRETERQRETETETETDKQEGIQAGIKTKLICVTVAPAPRLIVRSQILRSLEKSFG